MKDRRVRKQGYGTARPAIDPTQLRKHLFYETSHSPRWRIWVGYESQEIIDFCFIANPYYPTPEMFEG